jgi:hypothetical protein
VAQETAPSSESQLYQIRGATEYLFKKENRKEKRDKRKQKRKEKRKWRKKRLLLPKEKYCA